MKSAVILALVGSHTLLAFPHALFFEENRGQVGSETQYLARVNGNAVAFTRNECRFSGKPGTDLSLLFPGASTHAAWEPLDPLPGSSSYFIGADRKAWVVGAAHFGRLIRRNIYPGIDVVFKGGDAGLEYDFLVHPGADPTAIRIAWRGADRQALTAAGELEVEAGGRRLITGRPRVFQGTAVVSGGFALDKKTGETHFQIGTHNSNLPLTIDPTLDVLRFLGGTGNDRITATDGVFMAGVTDSSGLLGFGGRASGTDIFLWDGNFYTLFGGNGDEEPAAIARVGQTLVLAGWTSSQDFPLTGAQSIQRNFGGGNTDGFLIYGVTSSVSNSVASYLGGSGDDRILALSPDPSTPPLQFGGTSGYIVAGETNSPDFPTRAALQPALGGGKDGFLTRIGAGGIITESTYWGGSGDDSILAADATSSTCWFAGRTNSPDLLMVAPLQPQLAGSTDGFLARLTTSSIPSRLDFATYYGGTGDDDIRALHIGPDSWIWVGGNTNSSDLRLKSPSQSAIAGDSDAWIGRFDPVQFLPSFVTFWGGSGHDEVTAIAHDGNGELYTAGFTNSADLPVINALQSGLGGGDDGFIARFDRNGQPQMATYAGGTGTDRLRALSVVAGTVTAAGESDSTTIPALTPAVKTSPPSTNSGQLDGLVVQFHEDGIYALPMTLGQNLTAEFFVNVVGAGNAGLPVTLVSTDPSRLLVNGGSFSTGAKFQLSAVAGDAVVDLVISVPGLNPRHVPITLQPSYLLGPAKATVAIALNGNTEVPFRFATTDPATGQPIVQALRAGLDPSISIVSSDTSIVQVHTNYNSVSQTIVGNLQGVGAGAASVTLVSPLFPVKGPSVLKVDVGQGEGAVLSLPDLLVGQYLQAPVPLILSASSPSPASGSFPVTFTSEDPSGVLLSLSPGKLGAATVSLEYGGFSAPKIWVQGRASSGVVRIRAEITGSAPMYFNVALAAAVAQIALPSESVNAYFNGVRHNPALTSVSLSLWSTRNIFGLVVAPASPTLGGYVVRDQLPSPEASNLFALESSDNTVVRASGSAIFDEENGATYILFSPRLLKEGTASLSVSASGFLSGTPIQVTVLPNDLPLPTSSLTLGKGFFTAVRFSNLFDFPANVQGTVTSADPSRVLVSLNQFEEAASVSLKVGTAFYVSALSDSGDVPITIAAPGYNSRTFTIRLAPVSFRLGPPTLTTTIGDYARLSLLWSFPGAPTGFPDTYLRSNTSLTFSLSVSDSSVLRNDTPTVTFSGASSNISLIALKEGSATVTLASASSATVDPAYASASVVVTPLTFSFSSAVLAIGKDMQRPLPEIAYPANPGKLTLRSSDPSRLLLSADRGLPGQAVLTGVLGQVYAQALADSGDIAVTASAGNYNDASLTVRLVPTAFGLFDNYANAPTVMGVPGSSLSLRVAPAGIDPASGTPIVMADAFLRPGLDPFQVDLQTSVATVGALLTPISFIGGLAENTTQFRAFANGTTEISAIPPVGYVDGGRALHRRVQIAPPQLTLQDFSLGKDMQSIHRVSVTGATSDNPIPSLTVTSSDPTRLLVSASPLNVGAASATSAGTFYAQALTASGDVTLTATAAGYGTAQGNVHLEPSYFLFDQYPGSRSFPANLPIATTFVPTVYLVHPTHSFDENSSLRPGIGSVTIPIVISDSGVLRQTTQAVFSAGDNQAYPKFFGLAIGSATLQIGAPDGFAVAPDSTRIQSVNVVAGSFSLGSTDVGKDRAARVNYSIGGLVEQAVTVHATISDPSLAVLSLNPATAGSTDLSIELKPGSPTPAIYVFGLASGGSPTLTMTGPGFTTASRSVVLSPSGFSFGSASSISLAKGSTASVRVTSSQPLRGGISPVTVAMDNSNPAVAQAAPAVFNAGDSYVDIPVTAKSSGIAVLTIADHGGSNNVPVLVINVP